MSTASATSSLWSRSFGLPVLIANTVVVGSLTTLVKIAGAAKTVIIARFFGATAELDAYLIAFLVPSFAAEVLCAAIVPALVPRLIELIHQQDDSGWKSFYASAFYRSVAFVALVACGLAVIAAAMAAWSAANSLISRLLLIMLPMLPISAVLNLWRSVLNAHGRFAVAAGSAILTPLATILSLAVAGRAVYWLAVGTTLGAVAEACAVCLALRRLGITLVPKRADASVCGIAVRQYRFLASTNFVMQGSLFLDQLMAGMLASGAISILNYGTRLSAVLIAIGPEALGVTLLPRFSQMAAEKDGRRLRSSLKSAVAAALAVSVLATVLLFWFSAPVVRLVFQHGAFAARDTLAVVAVQRFSLLQLPFAFGIAVLSRFLASAKASRALVPIAAASLALNALLNLILMRWLSVAGIALATAFAQAAMFLMLAFVTTRMLRAQETCSC